MNPINVMSFVIRMMEYFFHLHLLLALLTYGIVAVLFRKHVKRIRFRAVNQEKIPFERLNAPTVSFIIPAFNEGTNIIDSVEAALSADYPQFKVIVVDDGSNDNTLSVLIERYQLDRLALKSRPNLSSTRIITSYQSKTHSNLLVIAKEHSGKADSLNVGIDHCDTELICCIDADSIITPDSLRKMVVKFIDEPNLIALGGAISPSNEIIVHNGQVERRKSNQPVFVAIQIIEYLRSFTSWRTGWSYLDGLLIIGGALTVFKRDAVLQVGGYRKEAICEDLEIILTLHQHFLNRQIPYHVWTIPDVICWTRVPTNAQHLKKQRVRWMYGALQSLKVHHALAFNRQNPLIGWMAFPHLVFIESFAPIFELLGLICFITAMAFGLLSIPAFIIYGFLIFSITGFYSWYALAINDSFIFTFPNLKQVIRLGLIGLIEPLGYRQRESYWRIYAWWQWIRGKKVEWGQNSI
jgi:cellulose synthase/poly-beta-1,6-N-acetylglucosamine synthase-like glycosyltransferase